MESLTQRSIDSISQVQCVWYINIASGVDCLAEVRRCQDERAPYVCFLSSRRTLIERCKDRKEGTARVWWEIMRVHQGKGLGTERFGVSFHEESI